MGNMMIYWLYELLDEQAHTYFVIKFGQQFNNPKTISIILNYKMSIIIYMSDESKEWFLINNLLTDWIYFYIGTCSYKVIMPRFYL